MNHYEPQCGHGIPLNQVCMQCGRLITPIAFDVIQPPIPQPPTPSGDSREATREEYLVEVITASRDFIVSVQKELGFLPQQQAYSAKMTEMELLAAKTVASLDEILAGQDWQAAAHRSAADRQRIAELEADLNEQERAVEALDAAIHESAKSLIAEHERAERAESELEKLRGLLRECESAMGGIESFVRFYMEREQNAPANSQEACREAREEEAAFNKALRAIRRALSGEERDTKSGEASEKNISS